MATATMTAEAAVSSREAAKAGPSESGAAPPIVCPGHVRPLAEVQFSGETADGVFLISACLDGSPMLRDGATGDWIGTFAGHKGAVWSAKLCREARIAATGSGDFSAKVWDAVTGACVTTLGHGHVVKSVDLDASAATLATAGHEGVVRLFDVDSGATTPTATLRGAAKTTLTKVCWVRDQLVAAAGADGVVTVWDARSGESGVALDLKAPGERKASPVMDVEIKLAGGRPTLTACCGEAVHLYDAETWTPLRDPVLAPVHFREEGGAALSPDGALLVLGGGRHGGSRQGALGVEKGATRVGDVGSDLTVFVVDLATGAVVDERKGHCGPVRCLRYHPSGHTLATGSEDGTIRIWDLTPQDPA